MAAGYFINALLATASLVVFTMLFSVAMIAAALRFVDEEVKVDADSRRGSGDDADLHGSHKKHRPSSHVGLRAK